VTTATFVWMFLILKIPILAALWLIWWAIKEPEPVVDDDQDSGGSDRVRHPRPRRPGPPRRGGPHASPPPISPARVRTLAKGKRIGRP
jgi:hypothetical protein